MGERLKPAVLKTVRPVRVSGVRIPPPPPLNPGSGPETSLQNVPKTYFTPLGQKGCLKAAELLERLAEAAAPGATIFQYGLLSGDQTSYPRVPAIQKALNIRGYWLAEITAAPETLAAAKAYVYELLRGKQLRPKIAKTFPFDDVAAAYRYMESNEQIGKIVLTLE